ncbi:hypothetical protein VNI00_003333 [Paramarasmius palmivorus]|uniref:Uncharacterized protein n=1 Tax=Paramarasmius palmivorus TaxID=297713 RepID=A0AAW0DUM7_9AGAR
MKDYVEKVGKDPRLVLGGPTGKGKKPPGLVLDVVEEKAEHQNPLALAAKNVKAFMPQLKHYAADSRCETVAITDYDQMIFVEFLELEGYRGEDGKMKPIAGNSPRARIVETSYGPRADLFCLAMERLEAAEICQLYLEDKRWKLQPGSALDGW